MEGANTGLHPGDGHPSHLVHPHNDDGSEPAKRTGLGPSYQFSQEELRALEECASESFYQRCLPLSTVFGVGALLGVKNGYLKPNATFGPTPKVMLGMVVGYFLGKLSYQRKCEEKLMAIPGSYLGGMLREKRYGSVSWDKESDVPAAALGLGPNDVYSDAGSGPSSSLHLDTERPTFGGMDGAHKYTASSEHTVTDQKVPSSGLTYEELRRKNRAAVAESYKDPYKIEPGNKPIINRPQYDGANKNKYGDEMD